jgi:hypothetical protein
MAAKPPYTPCDPTSHLQLQHSTWLDRSTSTQKSSISASRVSRVFRNTTGLVTTAEPIPACSGQMPLLSTRTETGGGGCLQPLTCTRTAPLSLIGVRGQQDLCMLTSLWPRRVQGLEYMSTSKAVKRHMPLGTVPPAQQVTSLEAYPSPPSPLLPQPP